mmetsp:Transcript_20553/g.83402  ORF Transcript_20553/g.83402 Transcript_20553/m.83402 type:complete len:139 (-) Transcript_20553:768-1184(-)
MKISAFVGGTSISGPRIRITGCCHRRTRTARMCQSAAEDKLGISFTCGKCDTRISKKVKRQSYTKGVVIIECPTCKRFEFAQPDQKHDQALDRADPITFPSSTPVDTSSQIISAGTRTGLVQPWATLSSWRTNLGRKL